MRKFTITIVFLLGTLSINAQMAWSLPEFENTKQIDSISRFLYNPGPDSILANNIIYQYDARGNMVQITNVFLDQYLIEELKSRYNYAYDESGNEILEEYYNWDKETNEWDLITQRKQEFDHNNKLIKYQWSYWDYGIEDFQKNRREYLYNEFGNILRTTFISWDTDKKEWLDYSKTEAEYDSLGNEVLFATFLWDSTLNEWVGQLKIESAYDSNQRIVLGLHYNWSQEDSGWIYTRKREYAYDEEGNQILFVRSFWNNEINDWLGSWREEMEYNELGKLSLFYKSNWDEASNDFVRGSRQEWTYHSNGDTINYLSAGWNNEEAIWENYSKIEYEYYDDGRKMKRWSFSWREESEQWSNTGRSEIEYDHYGNIIVQAGYWNGPNGWTGNYKNGWEYDDKGKLLIEASYRWDSQEKDWRYSELDQYIWDEEYDLKTKLAYRWMDSRNDLGLIYRLFYYYEAGQTSIETLVNPEIKIYPNPANEYINISGSELPVNLSIFSLDGRLVDKKYELVSGADISTLKSGIYFIEISQGNKILGRMKFIKSQK